MLELMGGSGGFDPPTSYLYPPRPKQGGSVSKYHSRPPPVGVYRFYKNYISSHKPLFILRIQIEMTSLLIY